MSLAIDSPTLQERLDDLREEHDVPGASVAVLRDGAVVAAASGTLNLDTGVEATTDSLFQIGSITKVWTATVIMQLVEGGRVELDAPVRRYLPDFRVADEDVSASVTVQHLLTHTSGIDGDHFADTGRGDDALAAYVESCAEVTQVHPLGATMSYCNTGYSILGRIEYPVLQNTGYSILGRIVEVVTDAVWDEAIRTRLAEPLDLTHTATLAEDVLRFRAAIGHIEPPGHERSTAPAWGLPRSAGPAGGICSTASDLLGFAALHLGGVAPSGDRLLREDSLAAMREPLAVVPSGIGPFPPRWGLGWSLGSGSTDGWPSCCSCSSPSSSPTSWSTCRSMPGWTSVTTGAGRCRPRPGAAWRPTRPRARSSRSSSVLSSWSPCTHWSGPPTPGGCGPGCWSWPSPWSPGCCSRS